MGFLRTVRISRCISRLIIDLPLGAFVNYLPTPLVLLTDSQGNQNVHIAPEAFAVASAEFPDQINVWQDATQGKLESVSVPPLTIYVIGIKSFLVTPL